MLPSLAGLGREEIPRRNSQVTEIEVLSTSLALLKGGMGGEKGRFPGARYYLTEAEFFWSRFMVFIHNCIFANKTLESPNPHWRALLKSLSESNISEPAARLPYLGFSLLVNGLEEANNAQVRRKREGA